MKLRWILIFGLVAMGAFGAFLLLRSNNGPQEAVEETRRALRQQGFKTDLTEFNFSTSPELRARAAALTRGEFSRSSTRDSGYGWSSLARPDHSDLMAAVGTDAALVVWKQEKLLFYPNSYPSWPGHQPGQDLWPVLRTALNENRADLDTACEAASSGPIRFNLVASHGSAMLLPHLGALKSLMQMLGTRTVVELHDRQRDAAWTNLLASTRLVTAWDPEPTEVSQLVRYGLVALVYNATWQTLQAGGWADDRLAQLQQEWESVDFFRGLPETAAFTRASAVATCRLERQQPLSPLGLTLSNLRHSLRSAWAGLSYYWRDLNYRHHGTYEDEKGLLLHYRDLELQLRRAVQSPTWSEMRQLPGVTNMTLFQSKYSSRLTSMLRLRQMGLVGLGVTARGQGLLGRTADAEARRRLIITAIALERYRGRHGSYPKFLQALVLDLLKTPPLDFMDGQPLRYHLTADGHFVLYSVGLDCEDNGGEMRRRRVPGMPLEEVTARLGFGEGSDLVWPRPASAAEVEDFHREEIRAEAERTDRMEEAQAEAWWNITSRRQSNVGKALSARATVITNEPVYGGRRLSGLLSNRPGTNEPSLFELLALKHIVTGAEPETVAFELPIRYEALTNLGELVLCIDRYGPDYEEGWGVGHYECVRATNGDCRLVWSTIYETPGKHALLAGLDLKDAGQSDEGLFGPVTPVVVTNLCQFTPESASFDPELGAKFYARLPEPDGTYLIDIKSPTGERLKTISGSTSNGLIKVHWDLTDDHGKTCTNESYDSVFHLTLPGSGRSQMLKGP
jgi:hypothetical protein